MTNEEFLDWYFDKRIPEDVNSLFQKMLPRLIAAIERKLKDDKPPILPPEES